MSRYFLVDYERVREKADIGLDGIENLTEDDIVLLLLSDETANISFQVMRKIMASPAKIQQKLMPDTGDMAVECALSFLIGSLGANHEIILISEDRFCFEFLQIFAGTVEVPMEFSVSVYADISEYLDTLSAKVSEPAEESAEEEICEAPAEAPAPAEETHAIPVRKSGTKKKWK